MVVSLDSGNGDIGSDDTSGTARLGKSAIDDESYRTSASTFLPRQDPADIGNGASVKASDR